MIYQTQHPHRTQPGKYPEGERSSKYPPFSVSARTSRRDNILTTNLRLVNTKTPAYAGVKYINLFAGQNAFFVAFQIIQRHTRAFGHAKNRVIRQVSGHTCTLTD